jgi:hypothetical protein
MASPSPGLAQRWQGPVARRLAQAQCGQHVDHGARGLGFLRGGGDDRSAQHDIGEVLHPEDLDSSA